MVEEPDLRMREPKGVGKSHGFLLQVPILCCWQSAYGFKSLIRKKKKADSSCLSTAVVIFRYAPTQNGPIPSIDFNPFFGNRKDRKVQAHGL
jgi:hypothetical protein